MLLELQPATPIWRKAAYNGNQAVVIRAILFDADGVIQHATDDLEQRLRVALGFVPQPLDRFMHEIFEAEWPALSGHRDFAESVAPVVEKWGAVGRARPLVDCWASIEADQQILALVAELRGRGYLCALATNQQRHRAAHMAVALGYRALFDRSFYSCELGFVKPDRRYFLALLSALPFAAEEILFIDDRKANVAAAQSLGLNAAHFVHDRGPNAALDLRLLLTSFGVH